jgi:molecular chaperone GrpE
LEERLLRLAAEFDNYKKRTSKEYQQLIKTANENLILQLVSVLDNFELALRSSHKATNFDALHQGVELIYQHLMEILAREGLVAIEAMGKPFDPHRHEAVMQVQNGNHPPDTVVGEMQKGYLLGEKLIRPSRVFVSRGPEGGGEKEMEQSIQGKKEASGSEGA